MTIVRKGKPIRLAQDLITLEGRILKQGAVYDLIPSPDANDPNAYYIMGPGKIPFKLQPHEFLAIEVANSFESVQKLTKDLRFASTTIGTDEARYLVRAYYQIQDARIARQGQVRSINQRAAKEGVEPEPHETLVWLFKQNDLLEKQLASAMLAYARSKDIGQWALSIIGIGGILAAGHIANVDLDKATKPSSLWRFGGIVGEEWKKGQKRPWSADMKQLYYKVGESFVKFQNHDDCMYGHEFARRKKRLTQLNDDGYYKKLAAERIDKVRKTTEAYKAYSQGRLPPGQIHAWARRWAVRLFWAHYYEVACRLDGRHVKPPYTVEYLKQHETVIKPPNLSVVNLEEYHYN